MLKIKHAINVSLYVNLFGVNFRGIIKGNFFEIVILNG